MVKEIDEKFMHVFRLEVQDLTNRMREELSLYINDMELAHDRGRMKDLFRYAHTLKGSSDSAGFNKMNEIAAFLTDIFREAKDGKATMNVDSIHMLLRAVEACRALLDGGEVEGVRELLQQLGKIRISKPEIG